MQERDALEAATRIFKEVTSFEVEATSWQLDDYANEDTCMIKKVRNVYQLMYVIKGDDFNFRAVKLRDNSRVQRHPFWVKLDEMGKTYPMDDYPRIIINQLVTAHHIHKECKKSRSLHLDQHRHGPRAALYFLGAWFLKTHESDMDAFREWQSGAKNASEPPGVRDIVGPTRPRGHTNGVILKSGRIVAEFGDTERVDMTFSATKSYMSTTVGLAWGDGLIPDLDAPVGELVKE